ncbi:MAG: DUF6544 family protein [Rhizobiaceae bacterium]
MTILTLLALATLLVVLVAAAASHLRYQLDMRDARTAWKTLADSGREIAETFDPQTIRSLPEAARRYLIFSIAPGTRLSATVELDMEGDFALGDRNSHRIFPMRARQILSPPRGFVWMPQMGSGLMRMSGSDGYVEGEAWTRFWLLGLIPVARLSGSEDLKRSAAARSIMEAIWAPAALLPRNGAKWEDLSADQARVTFLVGGEPMTMTLRIAEDGRPLEVKTMRWSDANPEKTFRWQPFGGTLEAVAGFSGYSIPTRVSVGNHFGTDQEFRFFRVRITAARYLEAS